MAEKQTDKPTIPKSDFISDILELVQRLAREQHRARSLRGQELAKLRRAP